MRHLNDYLREFDKEFDHRYCSSLDPSHSCIVTETRSFLSTALKQLASEAVGLVPWKDEDFSSPLVYELNKTIGWNNAGSTLVSGLTEAGFVEKV